MKDLPGAVVSITTAASPCPAVPLKSDCTADGSGGGVYNINTLYANDGEIAGM